MKRLMLMNIWMKRLMHMNICLSDPLPVENPQPSVREAPPGQLNQTNCGFTAL